MCRSFLLPFEVLFSQWVRGFVSHQRRYGFPHLLDKNKVVSDATTETSSSAETSGSSEPSVDIPDAPSFFHDGVERPIERPKDAEAQKAHYSGKKKQHTVKNNILVNSESKVVYLTPTYEGRTHDKRIADISGYSPPLGSILYQDTGFQGFTCPDVEIIQPKKKPKGGNLTAEGKARNREISAIRIRVEHVIAGTKRFRIVKDKLHNTKKGFADLVMETCCGLYNFILNFRPREYSIPKH